MALALEDLTLKASRTFEAAATAVETTSTISTAQGTSSSENSEMKLAAIGHPSDSNPLISQSQLEGIGAEQSPTQKTPSQRASPDSNSCASGTPMEVSRGPACESATTARDQEV